MILSSSGDVAFYIGNFPVYKYGILMAVAVGLAVFLCEKISKNLPKDFFYDNFIYLIIFGFLGARLYYCALSFSYYSKHFAEIFNFREGGLSIHGAIIAGLITAVILSKKNKIPVLKLSDCLACVLPLSQAIGRWGNFFNSEAFGLPTYSSWGVFIPIDKRPFMFKEYEFFHPTFLYESLFDLLIFAVLYLMYKKNLQDGVITFTYLILYSVVRFLIEAVRIDSALDIIGIPVAQIISLFFIFTGIIGLAWVLTICKND